MMKSWAFEKWKTTLLATRPNNVVRPPPICALHNCPKVGTSSKCLLCWSLRDRIVRHAQSYDKVTKTPHARFAEVYAPYLKDKNPILKTCSTEDLWKLTVLEAFKRYLPKC
jgi:hypothetical protein